MFLNDDTELPDPAWLRELRRLGGPARHRHRRARSSSDADGTIQHGGVILGMHGFADHLFQGMRARLPVAARPDVVVPRTCSRSRAPACAVRRELFEELGGFDERFELCGSDVVLGLDAVLARQAQRVHAVRRRPPPRVGDARASDVPAGDFFASYWRYQRWIVARRPLLLAEPVARRAGAQLRSRYEQSPRRAGRRRSLGRTLQGVPAVERRARRPTTLAALFRVTDADARAVTRPARGTTATPFGAEDDQLVPPRHRQPVLRRDQHGAAPGRPPGAHHGVENRFVFWAQRRTRRSSARRSPPRSPRSPSRRSSFHDASRAALDRVPAARRGDRDAVGDGVLRGAVPAARGRKFYMIQDFEPMFYPAGTLYALAEESYRLGLYGLCNTEHMLRLYARAVRRPGHRRSSPRSIPTVFHAGGRHRRAHARPGRDRLRVRATRALAELLGARVARARGAEAPPRRPRAHRHRRLVGASRGPRHRDPAPRAARLPRDRATSTAPATSASRSPCRSTRRTCRSSSWPAACRWSRSTTPPGTGCCATARTASARRTVDGLRDAIERIVLDPELGRALARPPVWPRSRPTP